jgi:tRNA-specific 2-thiouridylase
MNQDQLGFIRFPLGNLNKPEVRVLAKGFGLPVADKPESQEICFVGKGSYADFVAKRRPDVTVPGEIVDSDGQVIGEHKGLVNHTIGQRRGIGIARPQPLYVLSLDTVRNRLMVGSREQATANRLSANEVAMLDGSWPETPFASDVVVRYRGTPMAATVTLGPKGSGEASIAFGEDAPIASPGQAVVFYQGDEVLGGGTIHAVVRREEFATAAAVH